MTLIRCLPLGEGDFWHIPPSLAKCMQSQIFREFLAYFKIKEMEDEKRDEALRNEQGLRYHK